MLSIPPATMIPACPRAMLCAANMTDFMPEPHILLTVVQAAPTGMPPAMAACRAGAWPRPAGRTQPISTSSTSSALTPPRSNADIAEELALFRSEMRQIAASIPGSGANPALDQFREEMEAVARDMSHRVDGATERIEHALDRVESAASALPEAARLADILERAEASAEVMESSIQGAVDALTSALRAMAHSGDAPNSVADTAL